MTKIIDFVTDQKFIDGVIEKNDALDSFSEHEYVMVGMIEDYQYIKKKKRIKQIKKSDFLNYIEEVECDGVFLHNLFSLPLELIPMIPKKIKVFWALWGFDVYAHPIGNPLLKVALYHEKTNIYVKRQTSLYDKLRGMVRKIAGKSRRDLLLYQRAVERVDYIAGVLPYEYDLIKGVLPNVKALPFSYSYTSMAWLQAIPDIDSNCGDAILVGNSADMTNNHFDVIDALSDIDLNNRDVYCPLSYSGNTSYVDEVVKIGNTVFGENFKPLRSFVPLTEYKKILKECGYCIFYHERQQALGNINNALKLGSKVFLSETNPVFKFYKDLGLHVFSIQKDLDSKGLSTPLTTQQVKENVTILMDRKNIETEKEYLYAINNLCK